MSENINQVNQLKKIERDENGLVKGLEYKFLPDGTVDWKAIIPQEYLYVNPDPKRRDKIEKKYGKSYSEIKPLDDKVDDTDLVQLLAAAKYLLKIYGYNSIQYIIKEATENYAAVNCRIEFIGNYITEGRPITFEDNACAHFQNTNGFGRNYLLEMATNRAFARCVRSFMGIGIVSKEELGGQVDDGLPQSQDNSKQVGLLTDLMDKKHVTWDNLVAKFKTENIYQETWKSPANLPGDVLFSYIERLKKAKL